MTIIHSHIKKYLQATGNEPITTNIGRYLRYALVRMTQYGVP